MKVTPEGKVKVLDFGLAKALENSPGNVGISNSPTLSVAATNAGVILGTASVQVLEGISRASLTGAAHFSFSDDGTLVYLPGQANAPGDQTYVGIVDRKGNVKTLNLSPGRYSVPRFSPDGKRVAMVSEDGKEANIYVYELSGTSTSQRVTFGGANRFPVWVSNDRIAFQSDREGDRGIFWQSVDQSDKATRLTKAEANTSHVPDSWAAGKLTFTVDSNEGDGDIWIVSTNDPKPAPLVVRKKSFEGRSAISSDGRWVAYQSNQSGNYVIYVEPIPATTSIYEVLKTAAISAAPLWSKQSNELFFLDLLPGVGRINVAPVKFGPTPTFGNTVPLPITRLIQLPPPNPRNYDVSPDGNQFIMVFDSTRATAQAEGAGEIRVVLHWFEQINQLLPQP